MADASMKACPFCGGTNGTDEQGATYRWRLWRCADCGACGPEDSCNITGSGSGGVREARQIALAAWNRRADSAGADPMAWPLPCDVKVGHGTHGKGTPLRTLVKRMQLLYDMAQQSASASMRAPAASVDSATWWALVMGAAASLEDAAACLQDPDAKRQAEGAAKHYRGAAQALWNQGAATAQHLTQVGLRRAVELTRADLGPDAGATNYPHVRTLLAFAEAVIAAGAGSDRAAIKPAAG